MFRRIVPPSPEAAASDASQQEWRAHYPDQVAQGQWHFRTQGIGSNILKLRAASQVLRTFATLLRGEECPYQDGQLGDGAIYLETGRHQESDASGGSSPHVVVGTSAPARSEGSVCLGSTEFVGRLPKLRDTLSIEWSLNQQVLSIIMKVGEYQKST